VQTEPPKVDPPRRKRRWFQFSLRTLLFWIVPYAAIYTAVVSLICSGDGVQRPVGTHGNFLYDLRMAGWKVGEVMAAEITKNMVIVFTVAWIALPILSWAIWRYRSRDRNYRRLRATAAES
jgi:hypothetical protein